MWVGGSSWGWRGLPVTECPATVGQSSAVGMERAFGHDTPVAEIAIRRDLHHPPPESLVRDRWISLTVAQTTPNLAV